MTPRGERLILALVGRRNAGKSSLINALTGQEIAIVSDVPGTTTDPVDKHYELLPLGPVTFYDTAGIDDTGELGQMRIKATRKVLYRTDIALVVIGEQGLGTYEKDFITQIQQLRIPILIIFNKSDIRKPEEDEIRYCSDNGIQYIIVSAMNGDNIRECKELLMKLAPEDLMKEKVLVGDLVKAGDRVVLVVPIDLAAPKGRLILPQVQVIRELLDNDVIVTIAKERELEAGLESLKEKPDLVITDSQVVLKVAGDVPEDVKLTTFSILFARYKGELDALLKGSSMLDKLKDGDKVLIAEACSHHVQSDDIGRVKIPRWISQYTGKDLIYEVYAGHDFPDNLEEYALAIHCGGCMINQMEMGRRIIECERRNVPITNYGLAISKLQGVLDRVTRVFKA
ncbi:MAG TPA: [FeFe] hydrogenase H-cluster maturation GTPase HydF [Candidatus Cloacimonadota bacterium]|nr:[FeFe] hydrogenase H-cluster maturation GTPase HydF [Candidatus Cloacimonadota bacterium]HPT71625.1 [FeFe] hydrogenase H-cluster maturation GTPase HydF [Candidatus Cloacimonadota bacterium]